MSLFSICDGGLGALGITSSSDATEYSALAEYEEKMDDKSSDEDDISHNKSDERNMAIIAETSKDHNTIKHCSFPCFHPELDLEKCSRQDCQASVGKKNNYLHHVCQIKYQEENKLECDGCLKLCHSCLISTPENQRKLKQSGPSECKKTFIESNNDWRCLLAMCVGCRVDDENFPSIESEPYKSAKNKNKIIPSGPFYKEEVVRRSKLVDPKRIARPNNWKIDKCLLYLKQNHVFEKEDVEFLVRKEKEIRLLLTDAEKEKEEETTAAAANNTTSIWRGELPYLCLYTCCCHDSIKPLYM